jgi:Secretion system C-terminal sorting domain
MMKQLLFLLFFAAFISELKATHIVGGEMSYTFVTRQDTNRYTFKMKVYRDIQGLAGAPLDPWATILVSQQGVAIAGRTGSANVQNITLLELPPIRWLMVPTNFGVEVGSYEWTMNLPISNLSYTISYQRCCRNLTVQNIVNPGDVGATYSVEITPEAQRLGNNSPIFGKFPPLFICVQEPINVLQNATDIDGDRLVYRLCSALDGSNKVNPTQSFPPPFLPIPYAPTYSATRPMTGVPPLSIDSLTGRIIGRPDIIGQFIVTICVEEYRNNVLLGKIYRDFQFNVVPCQSPPTGGLAAPVLLTPLHNSTLPAFININMTWTTVPNAASYLFEISQSTEFGDAFQFVTSTPNKLLTNTELLGFLKPNQQYFWRTKAFRSGEVASNYSSTFTFTTGILNKSTELIQINDFSIQPNPLSNSAYFSIKMVSDKAFDATVSLTNMAGQTLLQQKHAFIIGENTLPIAVGKLPNGVYMVGIGTGNEVLRKKLVVQN